MELTSPLKSTLREYAELALRLCLSALIFAILMLPIVGLSALSDYLVRLDVSSRVVIYALNSVEYMLFLVSTIAFFVSIVTQTVRTLRRTRTGDVQGSSHKSAEIPRHWQAIGLVVTATVAMLLATGLLVVSYLNGNSASITYETASNESRTQQLEDGTVVSLGAQSKLRINFTSERRVVQQLQGEVTFDVAEDAARPFIVSTFLVDLAQGTKFAVVVDTTVTVTVHEGILSVARRDATPGSPEITVKRGDSYRVPVDGLRTVDASNGGQRCTAASLEPITVRRDHVDDPTCLRSFPAG
jgi:hypothetical protein